MIAICIASSHQRGMGHFYRALNILEYLRYVKEDAVLFINNDMESIKLLEEKNVSYEVVDYSDTVSNWEKKLIYKYHVDVWLLDKFETSMELAKHVKNESIILAAIDDKGAGADLVDLHFCSMLFQDLRGKKIYTGKEYMVLNPEIAVYRRKRTKLKKVLITLGGSDTYGVTVEIVKILKKKGYDADIVIGPNFQHHKLLEKEINDSFAVYNAVASLAEMFYGYDLAVTGGGVTCFEANASGLPCIIVANELHEIDTGKYLASFGGAAFAGYYKDISEEDINIEDMDIEKMSEAALRALTLDGMTNIYYEIQKYRRIYERGCID